MKLLNLILFCLCALFIPVRGAEEAGKPKQFPEWSFCVAYTIRDADEREARPAPGGDPFSKGETSWIPKGSLLHEGQIIDVAALTSRTVAQKTLTKEASEKAIAASLDGKARHPVMDCYEPHHLFVFYSYFGKPVACIEVCLTCNHVKTQLDPKEEPRYRGNADLTALARILSDAGLPLNPYQSFEEYKKRSEAILERSK